MGVSPYSSLSSRSTSSGALAGMGANYSVMPRRGTQAVNGPRTLESSFSLLDHARVAQLAEQGTLNPKVQGSIPCASTNMHVQVRLIGLNRPSADGLHTFG